MMRHCPRQLEGGTGRSPTAAGRHRGVAFGAAVGLLSLCSATGCRSRDLEIERVSAPSAAGRSSGSHLTIDPSTGDVLATWIGRPNQRLEIFLSRSTDQGKTWSDPVQVTAAPDSVFGHEESAPVAVVMPNGRITVIWSNIRTTVGKPYPDSDIRARISSDGGLTWSPARSLNDDSAGPGASHKYQGAARIEDTSIVVAWLDTRTAGHDTESAAPSGHGHETGIYWARSDDGGRSWGTNRRAAGGICHCCRVSVADDGKGNPIAVWRQQFPNDRRETVVARLADSGDRPPVHVDDWQFAGCPDSGPDFAIDQNGFVHVVWYTGAEGRKGIYYARSRTRDPHDGFTGPLAVDVGADAPVPGLSVAVLRDGRVAVAYDRSARKRQALLLAVIDSTGAIRRTVLPAPARRPRIAAIQGGGALVSWTEQRGELTSLGLGRVVVR